MKCAAVIEHENGRWALTEVELRWLADAASDAMLRRHKELLGKGEKLDADFFEVERLVRFLRDPYKSSCGCC